MRLSKTPSPHKLDQILLDILTPFPAVSATKTNVAVDEGKIVSDLAEIGNKISIVFVFPICWETYGARIRNYYWR